MSHISRSTGIHVSDRILFKRCRRKWAWSSPLRGNLQRNDAPAGPLWMGTGFHFALEDYHGYNRFSKASDAFRAYCEAFTRDKLPTDWESLRDLATAMLDYYTDCWLVRRNHFQTLWVDGVPQVEVAFTVDLPGRIPLQGVFDRIVVDEYDRLWVVEYKTAARYDESKLETDPQVATYSMAATACYGKMFEGVVYIQFMKSMPTAPRRLSNGEFSQNKAQTTTYALYVRALKEAFGHIPKHYNAYLNYLLAQETPEGDRLIKMRLIRKNAYSQAAEYQKILDESADMLNPDLPLYPNPTRDCSWDCEFRDPCIAMDDGSDYEGLLRELYVQRGEDDETWRHRIQYPDRPTVSGRLLLP